MELQRQNGTLTVSDVREMSAANARLFRNEVCAVLAPGLKRIEIDLSQTSVVDSCGLGALVSLYKAANEHSCPGGVRVRLLQPPPPVRQILELTRLHRLFEIVPGNGEPANGSAPPGHPSGTAGSTSPSSVCA